jgi:hypothetical protein
MDPVRQRNSRRIVEPTVEVRVQRILKWAFGLLVPVSLVRMFHLTWILIVATIIAVIVVLLIQASRRRSKPTP